MIAHSLFCCLRDAITRWMCVVVIVVVGNDDREKISRLFSVRVFRNTQHAAYGRMGIAATCGFFTTCFSLPTYFPVSLYFFSVNQLSNNYVHSVTPNQRNVYVSIYNFIIDLYLDLVWNLIVICWDNWPLCCASFF